MKKILFLLTALFLMLNSFSQKNITGSDVTPEEVILLVNQHNKWRTDVGVTDLVWSNQLATVAQEWANKLAKKGCDMEHSNSEYGENLYWSSATANPIDVVDEWASEIKFYKGQIISNSNYMKFGHYTQVVWSETTEVGCAYATCKDGEVIWVCNYNPPGNYLGEKPYNKK